MCAIAWYVIEGCLVYFPISCFFSALHDNALLKLEGSFGYVTSVTALESVTVQTEQTLHQKEKVYFQW